MEVEWKQNLIWVDNEAIIPFALEGTVPVPGLFQPQAARLPVMLFPSCVQFHRATALPEMPARLLWQLTFQEYVDDMIGVLAIACGAIRRSGRIMIAVSGSVFLRFLR